MYVDPTPLGPSLATVIGFGAIAIGALLMVAAGQEARDPHGNPARIQIDGAFGVRLIIGGIVALVVAVAWRLVG